MGPGVPPLQGLHFAPQRASGRLAPSAPPKTPSHAPRSVVPHFMDHSVALPSSWAAALFRVALRRRRARLSDSPPTSDLHRGLAFLVHTLFLRWVLLVRPMSREELEWLATGRRRTWSEGGSLGATTASTTRATLELGPPWYVLAGQNAPRESRYRAQGSTGTTVCTCVRPFDSLLGLDRQGAAVDSTASHDRSGRGPAPPAALEPAQRSPGRLGRAPCRFTCTHRRLRGC